MYEQLLGVAFILSVIVLIGLGIKYYKAVKAAVAKLPANATDLQKVTTAIGAIVQYAKAHPTQDKQDLEAVITVISTLGAAVGIDVTPYVGEINALISAIPESG